MATAPADRTECTSAAQAPQSWSNRESRESRGGGGANFVESRRIARRSIKTRIANRQ